MLVDTSGLPLVVREEHPPDPPADILARLRQIDSAIGMRWSPKTRDDVTGEIVLLPHWIVTIGWRESDPRWAMVQRGTTAREDACDRLLDLPPDCSAEEAYGYFVNQVKRWNGSKDEVTRLLSRAHHFNEKREQEIMNDALEYADALIEANAPTLFQSIGKTFAKFRQAGFGLGTLRRRRRS